MDINVKERDGNAIVYLMGSFDILTSEDVKTTFNGLLGEGVTNFSIHMEKVEFIDSSGLSVLVRLYKDVRLIGGDLKFVELSESVSKVFQLIQLDKVFQLG